MSHLRYVYKNVTKFTSPTSQPRQSFLSVLNSQSMNDPKDSFSKNMQSQSRQEHCQQYRLLKSHKEILVENQMNFLKKILFFIWATMKTYCSSLSGSGILCSASEMKLRLENTEFWDRDSVILVQNFWRRTSKQFANFGKLWL